MRAIDAHPDAGVHADAVHVVGVHGFLHALEHAEFALVTFAVDGDVVGAEHDVLRRRNNRRAVGGREDVVGGQHQHVGFGLSFDAQRQDARPSGRRRSRR